LLGRRRIIKRRGKWKRSRVAQNERKKLWTRWRRKYRSKENRGGIRLKFDKKKYRT
jgi:hypothetical protein